MISPIITYASHHLVQAASSKKEPVDVFDTIGFIGEAKALQVIIDGGERVAAAAVRTAAPVAAEVVAESAVPAVIETAAGAAKVATTSIVAEAAALTFIAGVAAWMVDGILSADNTAVPPDIHNDLPAQSYTPDAGNTEVEDVIFEEGPTIEDFYADVWTASVAAAVGAVATVAERGAMTVYNIGDHVGYEAIAPLSDSEHEIEKIVDACDKFYLTQLDDSTPDDAAAIMENMAYHIWLALAFISDKKVLCRSISDFLDESYIDGNCMALYTLGRFFANEKSVSKPWNQLLKEVARYFKFTTLTEKEVNLLRTRPQNYKEVLVDFYNRTCRNDPTLN